MNRKPSMAERVRTKLKLLKLKMAEMQRKEQIYLVKFQN